MNESKPISYPEFLANDIYERLSSEEVAQFIALLEAKYQNWEVTENLIKHFKHLEDVYKRGFKPQERADLSPKSLL